MRGSEIKSLNQLLNQQLGNYSQPVATSQLPSWLRSVENKLRFSPKVDLTYDLSEQEIDEILNQRSGPAIRELHSGKAEDKFAGTEVLAFYKPFAYSSAMDFLGWGIHFNLDAIMQFAAELMVDFKRININLKYGEAVQFIFEMVRRHELEHAVTEILGAFSQKSLPQKIPNYISLKNDSLFSRSSEIVATQQEMINGIARSKVDKSKLIPLLLVWSALPLPMYYREWNVVSTERSEHELLSMLGLIKQESALRQIRSDVGLVGKTTHVTIPNYFWFGNFYMRGINTPFLRTVFDCKKMSKFLKRNDDKAPLGTRVRVVPSSDHDFQIVSENMSRPIKFACHAWREVPEMVIGQLAEAFGANSTNEFKKYLSQQL